jgi:hypothetical protein
MPITTRLGNVLEAHNDLLFGSASLGTTYTSRGNRWQGNPNTNLLDDFEKLLVYLFSEDADLSIKYRTQAMDPALRSDPPRTKLDAVKEIWELILPHRQLLFSPGKVQVSVPGSDSSPYEGANLSDGERIILYLIGECLAAPHNGVIVIDEPEVHLHKSVQAPLWDAIEAERSDCTFVYLTHDLDFAATRAGAVKIWLKTFDGNEWDWHVVTDYANEPVVSEQLLLTILGSRKPVLFIEGDQSSIDYVVYRNMYPAFTVVPCGSCEHVIHATRSFAALKHLHNLECRGIIDRDHRSDEEAARLCGLGVYVLTAAEVENLLITEEVLLIAAAKLLVADAPMLIQGIKTSILAELRLDKERVTSAMTSAKVEAAFRMFDPKVQGQSAITASVQAILSSIDVPTVYKSAGSRVELVLKTDDYNGAISIYSNKGLIHTVARAFGMAGEPFRSFVLRLIASADCPEIRDALRLHLPQISL